MSAKILLGTLMVKDESQKCCIQIKKYGFYLFIYFFRENKSWHYVKTYFLWKVKKKKNSDVVCYKFCLAL